MRLLQTLDIFQSHLGNIKRWKTEDGRRKLEELQERQKLELRKAEEVRNSLKSHGREGKMHQMLEKRKFPRAPLAVLLEIWSEDQKETEAKGFITNLSEGGMALETNFRLKVGENFLLRFTLSNGWNFDLWGKIMYARAGVLTKAYGINFTRVETEERGRIKHFVKTSLEIK